MASSSLRFLPLFKILQGVTFHMTFIFTCLHFSLKNFVMSFLASWNQWRMSTKTGIIIRNIKGVLETCSVEKSSDGELFCMEEMKIVMSRLGIGCDQQGKDEDDVQNWKISDFSEIILDEEPSLEEIKQVFQVFDENKDGFIDASEVQMILRGLCLEEGSELEDCRRMICAFDNNADGLLDFQEFLAFMDKCFS